MTKQESTCRLCASEVNTQRAAYTFSWGAAQDCSYHRSLWESADDAAHRSGCPWTPNTCPRLHCERSAA